MGRSRGSRRGDDDEGENASEIGSGCYILRDRGGPAVSNLATFGAAGSRVLAGDRVKGIYIHFDPNNPIPRIPIWNTISVLSPYTYTPFSSSSPSLCFFFSFPHASLASSSFSSSYSLPEPGWTESDKLLS